MEYDDAISTIGTLLIVQPHPNSYILLKVEKIVNTCSAIIIFNHSNVLGCIKASLGSCPFIFTIQIQQKQNTKNL